MVWAKIAEYMRRYLGLFFNRRVLATFLILMTAMLGVSGGAILFFERNAPDGLRSPAQVFWWVVLNVLGVTDPGFFPASTGARLISVLLVGMSTVLLWLFSAIVVTIVLDVVLREGQGMGKTTYRNHAIICGWNETAEEIIEQIHSADPAKPIVVLADLESRPVNYVWVDFVKGRPDNVRDLERANVREAAEAIIFPSPASAAPDAESLLTALAIETINRDVYTCVEILNPKNREHFVRANVDEMFVRGELGAHMLARAILCKGLSSVVSELLRWDEGNEFYKVSLEDYYPSLAGKTFDDAMNYLRKNFGVILLGIERAERKEEMFVDPSSGEVVLLHDDCAVVAPEQETAGKQSLQIISDLMQSNGGQIPERNLRSLDKYVRAGKGLGEIATDLRSEKKQRLLAIRRTVEKRETFVNPKGPLELRSSDQCFLIAWDPPVAE